MNGFPEDVSVEPATLAIANHRADGLAPATKGHPDNGEPPAPFSTLYVVHTTPGGDTVTGISRTWETQDAMARCNVCPTCRGSRAELRCMIIVDGVVSKADAPLYREGLITRIKDLIRGGLKPRFVADIGDPVAGGHDLLGLRRRP